MSLARQRVVVIGATSGMGAATARAAAAQGADVLAAGRRPVSERDATDGVRHAQVDVTDELSVRELFESLATVHHLFVSASSGSPGRLLDQGLAAASVQPSGSAAMVTAALAGVEGLSRALALELGPVRVNTIRPGYTDSEMWSGLSDAERDDLRGRVAEAMPVGRIGTPEDIAQAALFLMTSRQTTGAVLEVSGGETLVDRLDW